MASALFLSMSTGCPGIVALINGALVLCCGVKTLIGQQVGREGLTTACEGIGGVAEDRLDVPVEGTAGAVDEVISVGGIIGEVGHQPEVDDGAHGRVIGFARDEVPVGMVHLLDGEEGVLGRSLEAVVEGKGLPWEGNDVVATGDDHRGDLQVREVVPESVIGAAAHFCHHGAAIIGIESDDGLYLSPQPVGVGHHGGVEYSGTTHRVPYKCHSIEVHVIVDGAVRSHTLALQDLVGGHQPGWPLEGTLLVQSGVDDADKSV